MEGIIGLKKSNCKNCYKCIRSCPIKSIAFRDEQVKIIGDDCIYCGSCLLACPQNAKYINSDLAKIKQAISAGEKLYVSLAPSYIAAFPGTGILRMSSALKRLGFTHIEETAIGAEQVTRAYDRLIAEHRMKNIITTSCPSLNLLVEKYYPTLVPQLAPVVTPVIAHSRMIKQIYGVRAKVVFIGPCISKKYECSDPDNGGALFAVMTFDELEKWFDEEHISLSEPDGDGRAMSNTLPRYYPRARRHHQESRPSALEAVRIHERRRRRPLPRDTRLDTRRRADRIFSGNERLSGRLSRRPGAAHDAQAVPDFEGFAHP